VPAPGAVVGVGMDLVEVERLRQSLERTPGLRQRVFTEAELAWADAASDPVERLAARFAAKEAFLKALGAGLADAPLSDIEVTRGPGGAPGLELHGAAADLAAAARVGTFLVSLTHTETTAGAVVVAIAGGPGVF
jgi:holo-[acyl-carrier protein] synthase